MKYIILSLALTIMTFHQQVNAQQGSVYAGGSMSFLYSANPSSTPKTIRISGSFSPEVGTFLRDNIQLGVGLNIAGNSVEVKDNTKIKSSIYGLTVYSRRFFLEGDFKPFVGLNANFGLGQSKFEDLTTPTTISYSRFANYGLNLNMGFAYALHPQFCVVGSFGFVGISAVTTLNLNQSGNTHFTAGFDLGSLGNRFTVGIYYTFKKSGE